MAIERGYLNFCRTAGHPFPENLRLSRSGRRYCVACKSGPFIPNEVDTVAIHRAVLGDPPPTLTQWEAAEAVRILDARGGLSARLIAERVGCSARTVHRVRARVRAAAAGTG